MCLSKCRVKEWWNWVEIDIEIERWDHGFENLFQPHFIRFVAKLYMSLLFSLFQHDLLFFIKNFLFDYTKLLLVFCAQNSSYDVSQSLQITTHIKEAMEASILWPILLVMILNCSTLKKIESDCFPLVITTSYTGNWMLNLVFSIWVVVKIHAVIFSSGINVLAPIALD